MFKPLHLVCRNLQTLEETPITVSIGQPKVHGEEVALHIDFRIGEIEKRFIEQRADSVALMEAALVTIMSVLNHGVGGRRGVDCDLFMTDGKPWPVFRHLAFRSDEA